MDEKPDNTLYVVIFVAAMGLLAGAAQLLKSCADPHGSYEDYDPREDRGQYEQGWP